MTSIILEFYPRFSQYRISGCIPGGRLLLGERVTTQGGYTAPWSACADLLVGEGGQFVGMTYPVNERFAYARQLVASANSQWVRYVDSGSIGWKELYGEGEWVEIRISDRRVESIEHALSIDGCWYLDPEDREELLAFGVCEIDILLKDFELKFDDLDDIPLGNPIFRQDV